MANALDAVARLRRTGAALVHRVLPADLDTPVAAYLKLTRAAPYSFLLESVVGGETRGRYSVIGMAPDRVWRLRDGVAEILRPPFGPDATPERSVASPVDSLRAFLAEQQIAPDPETPPMAAGAFGYLGYEVARLIERLPAPHADPLGLPDAALIRPSLVAVFDEIRQEIVLNTPVRIEAQDDPATAIAEAEARLDQAQRALEGPIPHLPPGSQGPQDAQDARRGGLTISTDDASFADAVRRGKADVRAGDVFQAVPSRRFSRPFSPPPFALYRSLRRLNPSPFLFFFAYPECAIVGASPEIMVRVRDGRIVLRPIAGTRPRGATPEEDVRLAAELLADPKERAEHLMLLDLGRNDVGRSARYGSVDVVEREIIERYSHVMHIVSQVEGDLREDLSPLDALLQAFPAGTVTGAPKIRAMEIIAELEPFKRGPYGGAVGYFSSTGAMDSCIALRTGIVKDGMLHVQAGAGVVADSDPDAEAAETRHKAEALLKAADLATTLASA